MHWERQRGHHYEMDAGEESMESSSCGIAEGNPMQYKNEECERMCESRAGLAIHMERMHKMLK